MDISNINTPVLRFYNSKPWHPVFQGQSIPKTLPLFGHDSLGLPLEEGAPVLWVREHGPKHVETC